LNAAAELTGSNQPASVSTVRFADGFDGWAFGPGLWVTHDGARTWRSLDVGGAVLALAASGGRVNAIVANCPSNTTCAGRRSTARRCRGHRRGRSWATFPDPCHVVPGGSLASIDAPDADSPLSLCSSEPTAANSEKTVVVTRNGADTVVGHPPYGGNGGLIAANGLSTILVSSESSQSLIYRSPDNGRNWTVQQFPGTGIGLRDLGFTTSSQAVMIQGEPVLTNSGPPPSELLMTFDAGASWRQVNF
jgi:hypothetical protein